MKQRFYQMATRTGDHTAVNQVLGRFQCMLGRGGRLELSKFESFAEAVQAGAGARETSVLVQPTDLPDFTLTLGLYEMRTYSLILGYDVVPRFCDLYMAGLEDKKKHDDKAEFVTLLASEGGALPLNTVIELWKHDNIEASQQSRAASRHALKWRAAVADIAKLAVTFRSELYLNVAR